MDQERTDAETIAERIIRTKRQLAELRQRAERSHDERERFALRRSADSLVRLLSALHSPAPPDTPVRSRRGSAS